MRTVSVESNQENIFSQSLADIPHRGGIRIPLARIEKREESVVDS